MVHSGVALPDPTAIARLRRLFDEVEGLVYFGEIRKSVL